MEGKKKIVFDDLSVHIVGVHCEEQNEPWK